MFLALLTTESCVHCNVTVADVSLVMDGIDEWVPVFVLDGSNAMGGRCVGGDGIEFVFGSEDKFGVLDWDWDWD